MRETFAAADFESSRQRKLAVDVELGENALETFQNVPEAGKIARRGFRERHAASTAAGARTDAIRLEYGDGFFRREVAQPGSRGQARETAAYDREVNRWRNGFATNCEINMPRRSAPVRMRI